MLGDAADQLATEPGLEAVAGMAKNLHAFAADLGRHIDARAAQPATAR